MYPYKCHCGEGTPSISHGYYGYCDTGEFFLLSQTQYSHRIRLCAYGGKLQLRINLIL